MERLYTPGVVVYSEGSCYSVVFCSAAITNRLWLFVVLSSTRVDQSNYFDCYAMPMLCVAILYTPFP